MVLLFGIALAAWAPQAVEVYSVQTQRPSSMLAFFARQSGSPVSVLRERRFLIEAGGSEMLGPVRAEADDVNRTIRLTGPKEYVDHDLEYLKLLDVGRRKLESTIRIVSPLDSVDARYTTAMKGNVPLKIQEAESHVSLTTTVRPNADGTFTIFLQAETPEWKESTVVVRVAPGKVSRLRFSGKGIAPLEENDAPKGDVVILEVSVRAAD